MKVENTGSTAICSLSGELDLSTVNSFRSQVDRLLENTAIIKLVFDFGNLRFIDSSGLAALLGRYKQIAQRGGKVVITSCPAQIKKVLEMSGVAQIMQISDDKTA